MMINIWSKRCDNHTGYAVINNMIKIAIDDKEMKILSIFWITNSSQQVKRQQKERQCDDDIERKTIKNH